MSCPTWSCVCCMYSCCTRRRLGVHARIGAEQLRRGSVRSVSHKPQLYSSSSFIHHRLLSSHLSFSLDRPTVDHLAITATLFTPLSPTLFPLFGPWRMMINSPRDGATLVYPSHSVFWHRFHSY